MNAALAPESLGRAELLFALGTGLILVSGLLPWIAASEPIPTADPSEEAEGLRSFDEGSTSEEILGIDRVDWVILAGVGLVATFLVVTEPWSQVVLGVAGAGAVAAISLGAVYFLDPAWMYSDWIKSDVAAVASAGPGAYLAVGGGLLQCAGWYLGYSSSTSSGAQRLDAPDAPTQPGTNQSRRDAGDPSRETRPSQQQSGQRGQSQGQPPQTQRLGPDQSPPTHPRSGDQPESPPHSAQQLTEQDRGHSRQDSTNPADEATPPDPTAETRSGQRPREDRNGPSRSPGERADDAEREN